MQLTRTCLLACLVACAWPAPRANACSMPEAGFFAMNMVSGVPDAQGNLNGQPNTNTLPEGEDVLLVGPCDDCSKATLTATLTDATNQPRAATLERIKPGFYWRLHPQQPLAAGKYTLKTQYVDTLNNLTHDAVTYVFKVQGARSTTPLAIEVGLAKDLDTLGVNAGTTLSCNEIDSCGRHTLVWTQWLPRVEVVAAYTGTPTTPEMDAYLYRLLPSDAANAADTTSWTMLYTNGLALSVSSMEQKPEYCVELQALRVADLTIVSLAKPCLHYTLPTTPPDPVPWAPNCTVPEPEKYARAWCEDNQLACSASNPRAARDEVKSPCAIYPTLCAPFIGNRPSDLVCM